VRFIGSPSDEVPTYMHAGVAAQKKALLRARVDIFDPTTINLLTCLQNVHDVFATWEWSNRLKSIARQYGLSAERLMKYAARR
jgi:hypothetical protein